MVVQLINYKFIPHWVIGQRPFVRPADSNPTAGKMDQKDLNQFYFFFCKSLVTDTGIIYF